MLTVSSLSKERILRFGNSIGIVLMASSFPEAYQLNPKTNYKGVPVLNLLLTEMEDKIGKLVVVFAGYEKDMDKLLEFNPGLPSRFPIRITFADYEDDELLDIAGGYLKAKSEMASQPFSVEEGPSGKYMRVLARRMGRGRGTLGFGNARLVQVQIDAMFRRQAQRLVEQRQQVAVNQFFFTKEDIIGAVSYTHLTLPTNREV